MKKYSFLMGVILLLSLTAFYKPTQDDMMTRGLKEALNVGTKNAVGLASKVDGYYKNPKIMIPFPPEVKNVAQKMKDVGLQKPVDDFVLSMNRAAEGAATEATPIFLGAIKGMTVADAGKLLKGGDYAITDFFRRKTDGQLIEKFTPVVAAQMNKMKVVNNWSSVQSSYNKIPFVKKSSFDPTSYTVRKAVDGLYILMADEEKKIRTNPAARTTDVLKKVFGNLGLGGH